MIVSETANRETSRWLQAGVLLCAAVVFPAGMTYAQDYDAVAKRLRAAVQAGELTGEQARAMLGALRETAGHEGDRKAGVEDERVAKYRAIAARIKAAVEVGKLSEEDAEKKLIAIRMEMWPPEKDGEEDSDEGSLEAVGKYLGGIGERIRAAVAEGKLSEEDGWAKWREVKEDTIKGAVAAGKISREEAGMLWREIEKAEAAAKLKTAIEEGELTEEMARAKWAEINEDDDDEGDEQADEDGDDDRDDDDEEAGIQPVPAELARAIGKALLEAAPMDFAGDPSQAVGVFAEDEEEEGLGMILVPADGLNEEEAEMKIGDSTPLALLFTSAPILPVADGRLVDRDRLHDVTITDDEGDEHDVDCMLLIVKRIAEEDYRLYGIANATAPLVDARFDDGEGPGQTPLALEVKDIDEESETAAVVITVFNKYQAMFRAGVAE